jgi:hypothetical protein
VSAQPPIAVIGDSHTAFFSGAERIVAPFPPEPLAAGRFEIFHVGPGLAASLVERQSENETRAKALQALARRDPSTTAAVVLCFGEIDCRFHILRRATAAGSPTEEGLQRSVEVTAHRYLSFVLEVALAGFRPIVFGPVASTPLRYDPPYEWPTLGSVAERNAIARRFDRTMRALAAAHGVAYVSIFEDLVDAALQTRPEHFFDGVHLGRSAWPLLARAAREGALPPALAEGLA